MDSRTIPVWAILTINGANLAWALAFAGDALGESPNFHHWPETIGLLTAAILGVATAALALVRAKNRRPSAICSAFALLAYIGGWLLLFGAHSF